MVSSKSRLQIRYREDQAGSPGDCNGSGRPARRRTVLDQRLHFLKHQPVMIHRLAFEANPVWADPENGDQIPHGLVG